MSNTLLLISNSLMILAFLEYLFMVLLNYNKKISNNDGFNNTKDILHEYNSINIIENKSIFTVYNIKRRVIKIASKCYYGSSISHIGIPLMEAGISAIDNKNNKYINILRKIVSNLKILYIFPIIAIIINSLTYNISDAKISLLFLIIFSIISYILIEIKSTASLWIASNIRKIKNIDKSKIMRFINNIVLFDKLIFLSELIMIIRYVAIIMNYN